MGTEVIKKKDSKSALESMAGRLQVSKEQLYNTLKKTAFKECKSNEDFLAGLVVANTYGLNPLLKEIYMFPAKGGGVVPMVPVDGWVSMVNRRKNYDGVELIENRINDGEDEPSGSGIASVTAIFHLKDRSHPVTVTEYMSECYAGNKEPWKRWPVRMLRHKAYIQGARIAFGFSGIYDEDESQRVLEATTHDVDDDTPELTVEKTETVAAEPTAETEPEDQQYALMLKNFDAQQKRIGDEKFFEILGSYGYSEAEEIPDIKEGRKILTGMANVRVTR